MRTVLPTKFTGGNTLGKCTSTQHGCARCFPPASYLPLLHLYSTPRTLPLFLLESCTPHTRLWRFCSSPVHLQVVVMRTPHATLANMFLQESCTGIRKQPIQHRGYIWRQAYAFTRSIARYLRNSSDKYTCPPPHALPVPYGLLSDACTC